MIVLCVTNQKGGVGKTTTADALAAFLRRERKARVLCLDLDAQCSLTAIMGGRSSPTVSDVLEGRAAPSAAVRTSEGRGDLIPGAAYVPDVEANAIARLLMPLRGQYDYVVIDTAPAISKVTLAAMFASDAVIVPTNPDILGLYGLDALKQTFDKVRRINHRLQWGGVLLTKTMPRTNVGKLAEERARLWAHERGVFIANASVRDCVAVKEAQALGKDIFNHAPKSAAAKDYGSAFTEILKNIQEPKLWQTNSTI